MITFNKTDEVAWIDVFNGRGFQLGFIAKDDDGWYFLSSVEDQIFSMPDLQQILDKLKELNSET